MNLRAVLVFVGAAALACGCSDDDDAAPSTAGTSPPTDVATSPPTTAVATTEAVTTTSQATTPPPPTTQSVEDVKAEVAAAVKELDANFLDLIMRPRLRGLERRVSEIAVPGSPYYDALVERVRELVRNDQYVALNSPDIRKLTIEATRLGRESPVSRARVTVCQVSNVLLIKSARTSPTGSSIPVGGTGDLAAYRLSLQLEQTTDGWRYVRSTSSEELFWEGATECPDA